jgi:hypothetical protein
MNRTHVDLISFYITNVCGLACPGCASYNNYVLKGHYNWDDARDRTHKWGELIDVGQITIIGGEPLLHPDINNWVLGVRNAFTHVSDLRILTGLTGSKLTRFKKEILTWLEHRVIIQISVHDARWWDDAKNAARDILKDIDFTEIEVIDGGNFPFKRIDYKSADGPMLLCILEQWEFFPIAQKEIKDGIIHFHNNDPEEAHKACNCKDCHYIIDGIMYKCVLTGISKMLIDQVPLDQRSIEVLKESTGLDPFVDGYKLTIQNSVAQCSLCPTKGMDKLIPIWPVPIKKPRFDNVN